MNKFYKIVNRTTLDEATLEAVKSGNGVLKNPSLKLLHKLGYWELDPNQPEAPVEEEGYKIFDDGYVYLEDGENKVVHHKYRKLKIVDCEMPEIGVNQELVADFWECTDTEYRHVIKVYDVIDERPDIDEETQYIKEKLWNIDDEACTKTAEYVIIPKIDNPPELEEGQVIVSSEWLVSPTAVGEAYVRHYTVRFIVDNPPELAEGEQVVDVRDDDDGTTITKVYTVMKVIDEKPELEDGQQIIETWFDDDPETNTRTYRYKVRFVVDEKPVLEDTDHVENEWWDDDGVTMTHRYEVHRYIDEPPVLLENQDYIDTSWEVEEVNQYFFIHTKKYEIRTIIDHGAPELDDKHFLYSEEWLDDGTTREKHYEVWELKDEEVPEFDANDFRLIELGIVDDPDNKTRGLKYFLKPIIRNKPDDDPDGNFKYVEDGEEDTGDEIVIKYKRVDRVWRTLSKLKLESALFQLGMLEAFDAYIDSVELTNEFGQKVKLRRFYQEANDLKENHPLFKPYFETALQKLGMTPEQASAMLDNCLAEYSQLV